jgi:hypothetical protein
MQEYLGTPGRRIWHTGRSGGGSGDSLSTFKKIHFEEPRLPSWLQYNIEPEAV